jgi:hypothetical protein
MNKNSNHYWWDILRPQDGNLIEMLTLVSRKSLLLIKASFPFLFLIYSVYSQDNTIIAYSSYSWYGT